MMKNPWLVVTVPDDPDVLQGALNELEAQGYWLRKLVHRRGEFVLVGVAEIFKRPKGKIIPVREPRDFGGATERRCGAY